MARLLALLQREGRSEFLIVCAIGFLITTIITLRTEMMTEEHPDFPIPADHKIYIRMATEKPFTCRYAPFCWRVANPLIARLLPLDLQMSFLAIAFTSIALTGLLVYYIAKKSGLHEGHALTGMFIFFSIGWAAKSPLKVFWLPDSLSFLFITLCIYCILSKRDRFFLIFLAAGVLVKETVLFVAPLYYSLNAKRLVEPKLLFRSIILVAPAVLLIGTVRSAIVPANEFSYWNHLVSFGLRRLQRISWNELYIYSVGTFGLATVILPFLSPKHNVRLLLRFSPFLLMVYSQILIADQYFPGGAQRVLVVAFPALILLALKGIAGISERLHLQPTDFLLLPLYLLGSNLINPRSVVTHLRDQGLTLFIYMALVAFLRRRQGGILGSEHISHHKATGLEGEQGRYR